ncbi:HIR3 [Candida pseudojiufengensis]|uniref:HIR3 n=1 Tax=Candida pseudojiufengensis TaxID=497109 RepID=UPI0022254950|nr:HIR3 [Candida pseudojiufengensis]KAI5960936.1 HIR3 [Candida pseudojiufengensis]
MSAFKPINLLDDINSKKDLEEEHTRELQVEQAFELYQKALSLQNQKQYVEAYKVYEKLFVLDIIGNYYFEEIDLIRGVQNGSMNKVTDELSSLSPSVKSLRYLIFRNRGFLYMDILKHSSLIEKLVDNDTSIDKKFKSLFYSMIEDFCVATLYNEADEKLLDVLYNIFTYLGQKKLAKFTLEYILSSRFESDDLLGFLPINQQAEDKLKSLNSQLKVSQLKLKPVEGIKKKNYDFLKKIKLEFEVVQEKLRHKNQDEISWNRSWNNLIISINKKIKKHEDENKVEDFQKSKLKYFDPYLLTDEPLESISFKSCLDDPTVTKEIVEEPVQPDIIEIEKEIPENEINEPNAPTLKMDDLEKQLELDAKQQIQRTSKRLSRVESEPDIPAIELQSSHFLGLDYSVTELSTLIPELKITKISDIYLEDQNSSTQTESLSSPLYLKDFIHIMNDWKPTFTKDLNSLNLNSSKFSDENLKLSELLEGFSSKFERLTQNKKITDLPLVTNDDLSKILSQDDDYITVKTKIINYLLASAAPPILNFKWDNELILIFNDWVLQLDNYLSKQYIPASTAMGILEILIDNSITLEHQVKDSVNSKKLNKAVVNVMCQDLMKINEKILKWTGIVENLINENEENEEMIFILKSRFEWSKILKENSEAKSMDDNKSAQYSLKNFSNYISYSSFTLNIHYPNYKNFHALNLENVQTQLTIMSVSTIFWQILAVDTRSGNSEAIKLLEDILFETNEVDDDAINSIRSFMKSNSLDMKLSLWNILMQFYKSLDMTDKLVVGIEQSLSFFNKYLLSLRYIDLTYESRTSILCKIIGFYNTSFSYLVEQLEKQAWKMNPSMSLLSLIPIFEICLYFEIHEEACSISSLKTSIKSQSQQSYNSLKDLFLKTVVVILACIENRYSKNTLNQAIKIFHAQLGASGICDAAGGVFLRASQEYLSNIDGADQDISQLIKCRYHYSICIDGFVPFEHETQKKEGLKKNECLELANFVLPIYFKTNTIKNVPKHDMKVLIEEMYEVFDDPDYDNDTTLGRNKAYFDYFLESTRINPRFVRDAFHGLAKLELDKAKTEIGSSGLYYLQGLLIFSNYKQRKKNMQGRAVEIENAISLFTSDLVCGSNRMESWFLMGQAYGYLVEDDLIWTSDKLTVPDRKNGTANLQRKSLICYLMAINFTLDNKSKLRIKPIVSSLMSSFAKELFGAIMEPMDMLALKVHSHPKFVNKPGGASFINVSEKTDLTKKFCLNLIKQALHLAIKSNDKDWTDYYYLAKVQKKCNQSPNLVLETMSRSCDMALKSKSNDPILEPLYGLVTLCYKYVKSNQISLDEALGYLKKSTMIETDITSVSDKVQFYELVMSALKQIDAADKKNWQHKPTHKLAQILYEEFNDVEGAHKLMSNFISLRSVNKQLVSIWKPESERPGKHFLYTLQYIKFYIEILKQKKDLNSLIVMIPKLRRSSSIMVNLYNAWELLCSSICIIIRNAVNVDETFTFTDNFINNLPHSVFSLNQKSMFDFLEHKEIPDELIPTFCFLDALNDVKKSNNGYGPTSLIDDTIVTLFFKIYTFYHSDTNFFAQMNSPGTKKKIAKKDIFPLVNELLKIGRRDVDSRLKAQEDGYNDVLSVLIEKQDDKLKIITESEEKDKEGIELQSISSQSKGNAANEEDINFIEDSGDRDMTVESTPNNEDRDPVHPTEEAGENEIISVSSNSIGDTRAIETNINESQLNYNDERYGSIEVVEDVLSDIGNPSVDIQTVQSEVNTKSRSSSNDSSSNDSSPTRPAKRDYERTFAFDPKSDEIIIIDSDDEPLSKRLKNST